MPQTPLFLAVNLILVSVSKLWCWKSFQFNVSEILSGKFELVFPMSVHKVRLPHPLQMPFYTVIIYDQFYTILKSQIIEMYFSHI